MTDLGELGLSSYEEKAYRALLSLGRATASDIAESSDVPEGRIYDVLNGLTARDLVRSRDTDPRTYEAVQPAIAADRLLAERKRDLERRAARYEAIAADVATDLAATTPSESRFWTAPLGSDAAVSLVGEEFSTVAESVHSTMSVPFERAPWERFEPEMTALVDHLGEDVEVRTLVTPAVVDAVPGPARQAVIDDLGNAPVRVTTDLTVSVDILDDERACLHVPHPTEPAERLGVLEVRDAALVGDLAAIHETAWELATPLADALDTTGEPPASD